MKKTPTMIIFFITTLNTFSQVEPPNPMRRPPPGVPIDEADILLIFIGLLYGVYKLKKNLVTYKK